MSEFDVVKAKQASSKAPDLPVTAGLLYSACLEIESLRSRLAEAEKERDHLDIDNKRMRVGLDFEIEANMQRERAEQAEQRAAKLREALEIYADPRHIAWTPMYPGLDMPRALSALASQALASDLTGSGDTGEPDPITAKDYDFCPHCSGSFSFAKPGDDGACPWCKRPVVGDTGEQGGKG